VPALPAKKIIDPTYVLSDHAPFWNAGYRALLAIEDADIAYPDYHTTADTLGNVTMSLVENTAKMALATLAQAAVPDTGAPGPTAASAAMAAPEAAAPARDGSGTGAMAAWGIASPGLDIRPNPVRATASIHFSHTSAGRVDAAIYDVDGRLIRRLADSHFEAGPHDLVWDGRDESGRRVSAGIYFVRVAAGNRRFSSRVVLLR